MIQWKPISDQPDYAFAKLRWLALRVMSWSTVPWKNIWRQNYINYIYWMTWQKNLFPRGYSKPMRISSMEQIKQRQCIKPRNTPKNNSYHQYHCVCIINSVGYDAYQTKALRHSEGKFFIMIKPYRVLSVRISPCYVVVTWNS